MDIVLRDYQETAVCDLRTAYAQGAKAPVLAMATGAGKCLAPGTPVLMYDGSVKAVELIKVGDLLMGPDSKPRRVLSTCSGLDPMYRIIPTHGGDAFECNEPHILSLVCNADIGARFRKDQVYNISVKDYLALSNHAKHCLKLYRTGVEFEHRPTTLDPYFLGVWLGDGNSNGPTITNMEIEIEDYLNSYAATIGHYVVKRPNGNTKAWQYVILPESKGHGQGIRGSLQRLNLINNKHIPKQYLINSRQQRLNLLAGLLDTDGHLSKNSYEIHVAHEQLGKDIAYLCRSLGFAVHVGYKKDVAGVRIGISGAGLEEIPCKVPRKQASERKQIKNALRSGFTVEALGMGQYYGFTIDGDHLFMLGDFTVTHNTYTFCYICLSAIRKGGRVLILVHKDDLIRQCSKSLANLGIPHGIISPNFTPDYFAPVQVASVFSLRADMPMEMFNLIIIDEAHHGTASSWRNALNLYPNAKVLGVTATPCRTDGQGLGVAHGGIFDALVQGPQLRELMDRGALCDYEYYAPNGLDHGQRAAGVLKYWEQICPGVPTVGFCIDVEDAKRLAATFNAAGYRAAHIDGKMKTDYRQELLDKLADGELDLVASCLTITEGTDVPAMTAALLMRYSKSLAYFMQITGRTFRNAPGKDKAYIIDCVNLVGTHGLPCDEREWTLAGGGESKSMTSERTKTIRTCDSCFRPFYMTANRKCTHCGFEQPLDAKEIKEIEAEMIRVERAEQRKKEEAERWEKTKERAKADSYESLLEIEQKRGYTPGWARRVFEARQKKKQADGLNKLL